jgi:hypothetical protein
MAGDGVSPVVFTLSSRQSGSGSQRSRRTRRRRETRAPAGKGPGKDPETGNDEVQGAAFTAQPVHRERPMIRPILPPPWRLCATALDAASHWISSAPITITFLLNDQPSARSVKQRGMAPVGVTFPGSEPFRGGAPSQATSSRPSLSARHRPRLLHIA